MREPQAISRARLSVDSRALHVILRLNTVSLAEETERIRNVQWGN